MPMTAICMVDRQLTFHNAGQLKSRTENSGPQLPYTSEEATGKTILGVVLGQLTRLSGSAPEVAWRGLEWGIRGLGGIASTGLPRALARGGTPLPALRIWLRESSSSPPVLEDSLRPSLGPVEAVWAWARVLGF